MNIFYAILLTLGVLILLVLLRAGYWYFFQYRFVEVVKGRLYRCQAMPGERLVQTVRKHGIRHVIDLRRPKFSAEGIEAERRSLEQAGIGYRNLPSNQTPTAESIDAFLAAVEELGSAPLLVHCRDGRGRCVFYCAIHLIEKEGLTPDQARRKCRLVASRGTFSPTGDKGSYLLAYTPKRG